MQRTDLSHSWLPAIRIAFRFTAVYVVLYVFTTQMLQGLLLNPLLDVPDLGKLPPMRPLVMWVGHHLLHVEPVLAPTGSGDTMYDWTQAFTLLLIAFLGTAVWTWRAREHASYDRLHKWFRLFLRFALGTTMLSYGFAKLWPMQMPVLFLNRLLEPFGNFSPMGVIWYSIGAAPWYERFIGCAEVLGGSLLFLPRTTLLGALLSFGVTTGVFVVNMTYDVPVKLFAFQLVLFSIILITPDVPRLVNMFLANQAVAPGASPLYGNSPAVDRRWRIAQAVLGLWFLSFSTYGAARDWTLFGGAAPRSPLFGIWDVDSMSINGEMRPPLVTDTARYQQAVFQGVNGVTFWRMDRTTQRYLGGVDTTTKTIALKKATDSTWKATLTYQRPAAGQLLLDGTVDGKQLHLFLTLRDLNTFLLVSRGFHWVQELPVNR